jgi:hypothetical protein
MREKPPAHETAARAQRIAGRLRRKAVDRTGSDHHVREGARSLQSEGAGHRVSLEPADLERRRRNIVHEHVHPPSGHDHLDVVPPVLPARRPRLVLRKEIPQQDAMRLGRILYARPEGRTCRIGPEIQQLEVVVVRLPTCDSG